LDQASDQVLAAIDDRREFILDIDQGQNRILGCDHGDTWT